MQSPFLNIVTGYSIIVMFPYKLDNGR